MIVRVLRLRVTCKTVTEALLAQIGIAIALQPNQFGVPHGHQRHKALDLIVFKALEVRGHFAHGETNWWRQ